MKQQLISIAPVKAGIVLAVMYGGMALIASPFVLLAGLFGKNAIGAVAAVFLAVLIPVLYAALGFVFGALGALLYNLIARFTGGLEFEFRIIPSPGTDKLNPPPLP